ncbi:MAG TPA: hypothetical protein VMT03_14055 [Polyangia bacterium]|nr:hypothetical protein [Polyangia bacterium]
MPAVDQSVRLLAASGPVTAVLGSPGRAGDTNAIRTNEARAILLELRRDEAWPALVALHELAMGFEVHLPSRVASEELAEGIEEALEAGRLWFYRGWGGLAGGAADGAGAFANGPAAELARDLVGGQGDVFLDGRQYRLVPAGIVSAGFVGDDYRPVAPAEARGLIERMAARFTRRPDFRGRWEQAAGLLTDGSDENGLMLLRYTPPSGGVAPADEAPATTPSQLKPAIAPEYWIEIELVYDDDTPFDGSSQLQLPGGRTIDATPDESGVVRVDGLTADGDCKLTFPDIAAALGPS